jgi:hypothetical protein
VLTRHRSQNRVGSGNRAEAVRITVIKNQPTARRKSQSGARLPASTRMTIRWLSIAAGFRETASDMRSPVA